MTATRIRITRTVRYRGGLKIERGTELAATESPDLGDGVVGWSVAHPRVEGALAHIPAANAQVI